MSCRSLKHKAKIEKLLKSSIRHHLTRISHLIKGWKCARGRKKKKKSTTKLVVKYVGTNILELNSDIYAFKFLCSIKMLSSGETSDPTAFRHSLAFVAKDSSIS